MKKEEKWLHCSCEAIEDRFRVLTELITPADEKTHGFNRVDDSPQIF